MSKSKLNNDKLVEKYLNNINISSQYAKKDKNFFELILFLEKKR